MESKDLKWIKKRYGEKFSHLCRDLFPTLLDKEGLLQKLISEHFPPSRELYDDITKNNLTSAFKTYIYGLTELDSGTKTTNLSPEELFDKAGYILYPECESEADIQSFRHYYYRGGPTPEYKGGQPVPYSGEELCTFNGGRLETDRVWFAVKKNVDKIRREEFKNPRREDDYGVSVLSIQFSRTNPSWLSIKNRYNHTIRDVNPDATFGNNLDNIIEGLTQAFVEKHNINLANQGQKILEIPGYVQAADGKFYKYNLEIGGIYYCSGNVIIKNGEAKTLDKDRYILFDYFVLDLNTNEIKDFSVNQDSFPESVGQIKSVKRIPSQDGLTLQITPVEGEQIEIVLDKHNRITGYSNPNIVEVGEFFLYLKRSLTHLELPKLQKVGDHFLRYNNSLTQLELPSLRKAGEGFLYDNNSLTDLKLPELQTAGYGFLRSNDSLTQLELPNLSEVGDGFLSQNNSLTQLELPNLREAGNYFLYYNNSLTQLELPSLREAGNCFLYFNDSLTQLELPSLREAGDRFLYCNDSLTDLKLPELQKVGGSFLYCNNSLTQLDLPNLREVGHDFLHANNSLTDLKLPKLQKVGGGFLFRNNSLTQLELPKLQAMGKGSLLFNSELRQAIENNLKNDRTL